ncbi:hypothetical protein Tco_1129680, partial [Tanacetum coccineum]
VSNQRMSTPVFVDPESSTQADGARSSRVPVPLPEDPYEAIRQAYLVGTDIESEPFEDPESETPESSHIVVPPVCHIEESEGSNTSGARSTSSDSTAPFSPDHPLTRVSPVLVPSLRRTARMAVRVPSMMSSSLSASITEVATMYDSAFSKRFRSSYNSLPSPTLPVWKRYRGMSEPILDTDSEGDELGEEEDEEMDNSLDSDSGSEVAKNEGPAAGDEDPGMRDESFSLGEDEAVPEGQQRAAPIVETAVGEPLGLGYGAPRCRELAVEEY